MSDIADHTVCLTPDMAKRITNVDHAHTFALMSMFPDDVKAVDYDRVEQRWLLTFVDKQAELMWRLRWL